MSIIEDGSGNGFVAKVDSKQRIHSFGVVEDEEAAASLTGDSYNINTGVINLTSDSKSAVLYVKNDSLNDVILSTLFYLVGNSTGGSGDLLVDVIRNPTGGTIVDGAVNCEMAGVNRNFGSFKTMTADIFKGAEGNTLTGGNKIIESIFNQAPFRAALSVGTIVIPRGATIGVNITPATGNTSIDVEVAASVFEREIDE